jgi:prepilin signal peptidase PulO-like enzyme (type II secretory pathway)
MFDSPGTTLMLLGIGVLVSSLINHCIYALAYTSLPISSWQRRPDGTTALSMLERLPGVGWLLRSRRQDDQAVFGKWFWVRPFLIEIIAPWLFVALYFYVMSGNTMPPYFGDTRLGTDEQLAIKHHQFLAYAILLTLLAIATFIDFDEWTIPDWITVPGTLIGIVGATLLTGWNWLEQVHIAVAPFTVLRSLTANSPELFPESWQQGGWLGLLIALGTWTVWCTSLVDFRWITRRGWRNAFRYAWASYWRSSNRRMMTALTILGWALILTGYYTLDRQPWMRLTSSLIGMWLGGLLVWAFRMIAGEILGQEALGFGDVTLMSMVGAFFGWQIVWLAFFLAPLFGVLIVITKTLLTGDTRTPFGPYLSAATAFLMLKWQSVWEFCSEWMFSGIIAPLVLAVLLVLLGTLLWVIHQVKRRLIPGRRS